MIEIDKFAKNSVNSLKKMRREILEISTKAKEGHIPSSFSILEILYTLYGAPVLKNTQKKSLNMRDRLIFSKGHGSLALYAVLAEVDLIKHEEFYSFCTFDSICGGHPDKTKSEHFETSSGSLGHGLPIAVGLALNFKRKFDSLSPRVFCLMGDQEATEGTTWESLLVAGSRKLNNLVCIIDFNKSGERSLPLNNFKDLFRGFGITVKEVNGHSIKDLYDVFTSPNNIGPTMIIANTIKGYGLPIMENSPEWHHKFPSEEELNQMLKALE